MAGLLRFWIIALKLRLQSASQSIGVTLYIAFHSLMCSKSAECQALSHNVYEETRESLLGLNEQK